MVCKFCGNEIEDGSDFCFICGQKVEANALDDVADVYSQPDESAPAPVQAPVQAPEEPVAEPVATAPASQQPVATAQAVAAPASAPAYEVQTDDKKAKKAKKPKKQYQTKKGIRFVAFLFAIIGYILYRKAKNSGNEVRATEILNAIMLGLDIKLAIVCVILIKKWMLA
ncbi:MAG: hypothetical protein ACI4W6_11135 [Acutalibacteraceae bacterium]